jgi:hypothetical protein
VSEVPESRSEARAAGTKDDAWGAVRQAQSAWAGAMRSHELAPPDAGFVEHDNTQRPHRAVKLEPPRRVEPPPTPTIGEIRRHDRLGGLLHEYYRDAA